MNSYVSIDIETTGLDPETCQVLSIGAVIDDWETPIDRLPTFECYVGHGTFTGEPYALSMHPKILRTIADGTGRILRPDCVVGELINWLVAHCIPIDDDGSVEIAPAGKNFGSFDRQFLERLPRWKRFIHLNHRAIDPGSLYYRPDIDDGPPDTKTCMERAGIPGEVAHTALEDALVVVKLLRHWWENL